VEIGHSVAAPFAGLVLAELGADVVKVESPRGGDAARGWGPPFHNGAAPHFVALNRGKRSLTIDLSSSRERDQLRELILKTADAVICNLRPGSAESMGLDAATLREAKPELIYAEIGAFGKVGPLAGAPGYDPLMQAYAGIMSITAEDATRPPIRVGVSIVDMGAGFWAVIGILSALLEKKRSGSGASITTSLLETALAWTTIQVASVTMEKRELKPQGSGASGIVPYQAFRAEDGWIVIAAGNDGLFKRFMTAINRADLAEDERFLRNRDRVVNREALIEILSADIAGRSVAEVRQILDEAGVPNAPVQRIDQLLDDPQVAALGILQDGPEGALRSMGLPLSFDDTRPPYRNGAPALGEHSDQILAEIGATTPVRQEERG